MPAPETRWLAVAVASACTMLAGIAGAQRPEPRPDVRVEAVAAPSEGVAGTSITVSAEVDASSALGATFSWAALLSPDGALAGAIPLGTFGPVALQAGESRALEQAVLLPAATTGRHKVVVVVDSDEAIAEANEYDNVAVSDFLRIRAPAADFAVLSVRLVQAERRAGEPLSVDCTVVNAGERPGTVAVGLFVSENGAVSRDDAEVARMDVTLGPGERRQLHLQGQLPGVLAPGDYAVGVIIDPALRVDESVEWNNLGVAPTSLNVFADTLRFLTTTLPRGTVFLRYFATLEALGGNGHHIYSVKAGRLPTGLTLNRTTGIITGVPTESGNIPIELEVRSRSLSDTLALNFRVHESGVDLTITTPALGPATVSLPYQAGLAVAGGEPPYEWSVADGALPPGLDLNTIGWLSGIATTEGHYSFSIRVEDALGTRDQRAFDIQVDAPNVVILTSEAPPAAVGEDVEFRLEASGGKPPYRWTAMSSLPPGLSLTEDGYLVGVPTVTGRHTVRVQATDASEAGAQDTALISVEVDDPRTFVISTQPLETALIRERIEVKLQATGGEPPLTWRLAPGDSLPQGFYLEPDETAPDRDAKLVGLSIRPMVHGFTVEVEDAVGRRRDAVYAIRVIRPIGGGGDGCHCIGGPSRGRAPIGVAMTLVLLGLGLAVRRR